MKHLIMYLPNHFSITEKNLALRLIQDFPFATLISCSDNTPFISPLPLLVQQDSKVILGHMARGNPHWKLIQTNPQVTAVFHGPHTYITPKWYVSGRDVPTWNYATVHVVGQARLIEDIDGLTQILKKMTDKFESTSLNPWQFELPDDLTDPSALTKAIVGFEIVIQEMHAKFKLSQNRNQNDRAGVIQGLEQRQDEMSHLIRGMMLKNIDY